MKTAARTEAVNALSAIFEKAKARNGTTADLKPVKPTWKVKLCDSPVELLIMRSRMINALSR